MKKLTCVLTVLLMSMSLSSFAANIANFRYPAKIKVDTTNTKYPVQMLYYDAYSARSLVLERFNQDGVEKKINIIQKLKDDGINISDWVYGFDFITYQNAEDQNITKIAFESFKSEDSGNKYNPHLILCTLNNKNQLVSKHDWELASKKDNLPFLFDNANRYYQPGNVTFLDKDNVRANWVSRFLTEARTYDFKLKLNGASKPDLETTNPESAHPNNNQLTNIHSYYHNIDGYGECRVKRELIQGDYNTFKLSMDTNVTDNSFTPHDITERGGITEPAFPKVSIPTCLYTTCSNASLNYNNKLHLVSFGDTTKTQVFDQDFIAGYPARIDAIGADGEIYIVMLLSKWQYKINDYKKPAEIKVIYSKGYGTADVTWKMISIPLKKEGLPRLLRTKDSTYSPLDIYSGFWIPTIAYDKDNNNIFIAYTTKKNPTSWGPYSTYWLKRNLNDYTPTEINLVDESSANI